MSVLLCKELSYIVGNFREQDVVINKMMFYSLHIHLFYFWSVIAWKKVGNHIFKIIMCKQLQNLIPCQWEISNQEASQYSQVVYSKIFLTSLVLYVTNNHQSSMIVWNLIKYCGLAMMLCSRYEKENCICWQAAWNKEII